MADPAQSEKPDWLKSGDSSSHQVKDGDNFGMEGAGADVSPPAAPKRRLCTTFCICAVSSVILAAFIYATVVQHNDLDKNLWSSFYGLQAAIPAIFLVHYFSTTQLLDKVIYFLSSGMIVWSIVFIVLISRELVQQDEPDADMREEYIFELSGACLGLLSAMYHTILTLCQEN